MAIKKIRMRPEGVNDYTDVLHPETSADVVKFSDGNTVESHKAEKATDLKLGHVKAGGNVTISEDGVIGVVLNATDVGAVSSFSDKMKTLTLKNGWVGRIAYFKNALGVVYLVCDELLSGTADRNTVIATLPTGYRPAGYDTLTFGTFGYDGFCGALRLEYNGNITIESSSFSGGSFVIMFPTRLSS